MLKQDSTLTTDQCMCDGWGQEQPELTADGFMEVNEAQHREDMKCHSGADIAA